MWNRSPRARRGHARGRAFNGEAAAAVSRARRRSARCCHYISHADPRRYQPANIAFDLFPPLENRRAIAGSARSPICRRRAGKARRICRLGPMSELTRSTIIWRLARRNDLRTRCATTARICASSPPIFRRPESAAAPAGFRSSARPARMAGASLRPRAEAGHHPPQNGIAARLLSLLSRERRIASDPARLLRLPKMPKSLPEVPNAETTNALVDGTGRTTRPALSPKRDRLLFECCTAAACASAKRWGLNSRISTAPSAGCACAAKGKKERQVPYGAKAAEALEVYLPTRPKFPGAARRGRNPDPARCS
jgi:integrase